MADRTVKAVLKVDNGQFISGMNQAENATSSFASKGMKSATDHKAAWTSLGQTSMIAGGVLAVGVGLAVKAFADFDKEMSGVQAVSGASGAEMTKLSKLAIKAGADTVFSASEAAKAEGELAKAGVKTADILGGALVGSLNLASAGGLDLADAATISAQAMNIFKLGGKDVAHIADVMAAAANKSASDVAGLGESLKQGGLVAAQTGLTLEDTVGTLAMFSDNALIGSDAGTSLKTMLQRLVPQSVAAQNAMDDIGFSAYDSAGKFVGMASVAQQLKDGLGNLTEKQRAATMQTIFGSDAVRGASILYDKGAAGINEYTKAVDDSGAAQRMASVMLNNLSGDFEALKGSIDTALIETGAAGNGVLRGMTQAATGAVNAFGEMPPVVQSSALAVASVAAAGMLAGGAFLTVVPKIGATKLALTELGLASKLTKANLMSVATGPIGVALVALTAVVGLFAKAQMDAKGRADDLRNSLDQETGAITANTRAVVAKQLQDAGAFESAKALGIGVDVVTNAALGQAAAMATLRGAQARATEGTREAFAAQVEAGDSLNAFTGQTNIFSTSTEASGVVTRRQADALGLLVGVVTPMSDALGVQSEKQKELAVATGNTADKAQLLSGEETALAKSADDAKKAHDDLKASIEGFGSVALTARGAARDYQAALDGATAALKDNGRTLDTNTEKGRANQVALEAIGTSALKSATANFEHGASVKSVTADVVAAHGQFVTFATKMGMSQSAANALANELGLTTDNVKRLGEEAAKPVVMKADSAAASAAVQALDDKIKGLKGKVVTVGENGGAQAIATVAELRRQISLLEGRRIEIASSVASGGRGHTTMAAGGYVAGPGTGTSDSINARLSNGEYVQKTAAVQKYGVKFMDDVNSMRFAAGGYVPRGSSSGTAASVVDMGGVRDDLAVLTETTAALAGHFDSSMQAQARTIETMRRQMAGAR